MFFFSLLCCNLIGQQILQIMEVIDVMYINKIYQIEFKLWVKTKKNKHYIRVDIRICVLVFGIRLYESIQTQSF
jgi:hypothetical protein